MSLTIAINDSSDALATYVTWSASPLTLTSDGNAPRPAIVRSVSAPGGGQLQFRLGSAGPFSDELQVVLPAGGQPLLLNVSGKFPQSSSTDKDVAIVVVDALYGTELGQLPVMVRIRKNANELTPAERDRFLSALVRLNTPDQNGVVAFLEIQNMHTAPADHEIHRRASFLPWHRAFILDLERRLQRLDPSVTVPFWRFDQPAPNVFIPDFMGVPLQNGTVDFSATNPLVNWVDRLNGSGSPRIRRYNGSWLPDQNGQLRFRPFDPTQSRAVEVRNGQNDTVNLGRPNAAEPHSFRAFARMENDPHGAAHVSFYGQISAPDTAPADPLFFMLHCNIDRLWARWQWLADRWADDDAASYPFLGNGDPTVPGNEGVGNFSLDTMWPWNGDVNFPRPNTAPGGAFPSLYLASPAPQPTVGEMMDYQGQRRGGPGMGFGYADIPLEVP